MKGGEVACGVGCRFEVGTGIEVEVEDFREEGGDGSDIGVSEHEWELVVEGELGESNVGEDGLKVIDGGALVESGLEGAVKGSNMAFGDEEVADALAPLGDG